MTEPVAIHRVTELDLVCDDWVWPFATARRAEIDAHFAARQVEKPKLWNGRVLLGRNTVFSADRLRADYFETDFASFLAWRDWGFPDRDVFNGFGMGALRGSDGAFALGEMGSHTANAGRVYFPGGTPDRNDLRGAAVDIAASVAREVEEETGFAPADYRAAGHWDCVVTGALVAMVRVLDVDLPGAALRDRIEANLSRQNSPELAAIHLVRDRADFAPTMPRFVTAFIDATMANGG
ncbi:MAG: NUDIX hydrolase [Rhodopseudomonas sp.]|uniref:NUDIX hydrolase n=1 Tax=Rhodopseudomonas sp. TaxID=1078 RepID=UPI0017C0F2DF|nr:NUDIX hydrolase [Rhodopseudomonas sp.]NVN86866.1 NUDIX hydrolase [Rhodopseudomonas sp.]